MKITSLVVFCVLFLFTQTALAERTVKNKSVCTNSDRPTAIPVIEGEDAEATITDGRCRDRFGNLNFHGVFQLQPDAVDCPEGLIGFSGIDFFGNGSGVAGSVVGHYGRGNSIKSFFVNLQSCINLESFEGFATYDLVSVSGEGRFEGVSGVSQCKADFGGLVGQVTGQTKCEGTLTFPH